MEILTTIALVAILIILIGCIIVLAVVDGNNLANLFKPSSSFEKESQKEEKNK